MSDKKISNLPKIAMDRAFPGVWLLGMAIFIIIVLMMFCAWRIFLFEGEANEIARERLLLERDRDEFLNYGSDLPQLVEKHRALTLETRQFEVRSADLVKEIRDLEEKKESLNYETHDLMGAIKELRAQHELANAEMANTKAELEKMRPESEQAKQQLAILMAQEKALQESITQKQKRESVLAANVEGLDRQRLHLQELVARLTEDKQTYAVFEKNLQERMTRFDEILAGISGLNDNYNKKIEEIDKARLGLQHGLETLNLDLQGVANYLETIKNDRPEWSLALNEAKNKVNDLQTQIEALSENSKRFSALIQQAEISDKTFQATLLTEAAAINHMTGEDTKVRAQIEKVAASFLRDGEILKNMSLQLQESGGQIRSLLNNQQQELAAVSDATRNIIAQMEKNKQGVDASLQAGSNLSHAALTLSDQVEEIRTRLKMVDTRGNRMEELLDNQVNQLRMLTGLSRQLSAEIDENRRQGMRLHDLIAAIQSALGEIKVKKEAIGTEEKGISATNSRAPIPD